nr:metal-dependent transcriptional regulator [Haloferula luteola]
MLAELATVGWVCPRGETWRLTDDGRKVALEIVRRHRLLETWMARETGRPAEDWHRAARSAGARWDHGETNQLADRLGNPRFDPHGDPIPTREGDLRGAPRVSMAEWPEGLEAVIGHLEDEPETIYREMVRAGLHPGMGIRGLQRVADGSMEFTGEGRRIQIPATWLTMIHLEKSEPLLDPAVRRLSDRPIGSVSIVRELSPACVGAERSRLLDLGLVPGTEIRCEFASPFGTPRSYWIRGTMIGLRREQAERVLVLPQEGGAE